MNLKEITINNIEWKLIDFPQEPIRPACPPKHQSSLAKRLVNIQANKIGNFICEFLLLKILLPLFTLIYPIIGFLSFKWGYFQIVSGIESDHISIGITGLLFGIGCFLFFALIIYSAKEEKTMPVDPFLFKIQLIALLIILTILAFLATFLFRIIKTPFVKWAINKKYDLEYQAFRIKEKEYDKQLYALNREFPGLDNHSFSYASYTTTIINEMLKFLQESVKDSEKRKIKDWWLSLSGTSFEFEVERWFQSQGYKTQHTGETGDGGVDIILQDENKEQIYVQCKHYTKSKVGVETVRNLIGAMALGNVRKGIIVCLLGITKDAQEAIDKSGIVVYTLADLLPLESYLQSSKKDLQKSLFDTEPFYSTNDLYFQQISPCKVRIGNYQINTSIMHDDRRYSHDIVKSLSSNMYSIFYKGYCFSIEAPLIEIKILENNIRFDRLWN